ncbi:hypothetical protein [Paenibacillus foliorum]|nr:hypothetical protein [Paenibacillus foliorum]
MLNLQLVQQNCPLTRPFNLVGNRIMFLSQIGNRIKFLTLPIDKNLIRLI